MKCKSLLFIFLFYSVQISPYPYCIEELYNEQNQRKLFLINDAHTPLNNLLPVETQFVRVMEYLNTNSPFKIDLYWEMDVPSIRFFNIFFPERTEQGKASISFITKGFEGMQKAVLPQKNVIIHPIDNRFPTFRAAHFFSMVNKKVLITYGEVRTEFEGIKKETHDLLLAAQKKYPNIIKKLSGLEILYSLVDAFFLNKNLKATIDLGELFKLAVLVFQVMDYYFLGLFLNKETSVSILYAGGFHCKFSSDFLQTNCNFKSLRIILGTKEVFKIEKALEPQALNILLPPGIHLELPSEESRYTSILSKVESFLSSAKNLPSYIKRKLLEAKEYVSNKLFPKEKTEIGTVTPKEVRDPIETSWEHALAVVDKIRILNIALAEHLRSEIHDYKKRIEEATKETPIILSNLQSAINEIIKRKVMDYCASLKEAKDLIKLPELKRILSDMKENVYAQALAQVLQQIIENKKPKAKL